MYRVNRPRHRGFSLVELAVVLIVIAVIAAIAIPTFAAVIGRSSEEAASAELAVVLRNAVAIAAFDDHPLGRADLQAAFDEVTAAGVGVSAAGGYQVCDEDDEGPAADCGGAGIDVWWSRDGDVVGVVVDDDPRVLGRIEGATVTDTWVDGAGDLAATLAGPPQPPPQAPAEPRVVLVGGQSSSASAPAIDDVRITSGAGTGGAVYLFDDLDRLSGPVATGTAIQTVTADPSVNNSPVSGSFGVAPNSWTSNADFDPAQGRVSVSSGVLVTSGSSTVDHISWDLTAGNYEASFKVAATTASPGDSMGIIVLDATFSSSAQVGIDDTGARLLTPAGQLSPPAAVTVGDRVGMRLWGTVYSLMVNDAAVWSSTTPVTVTGAVARNFADPGYDYTACSAMLFEAGPALSGDPALAVTGVGATGSFSLTTWAGTGVQLRIYCPYTGPGGQSQAWWYPAGTDGDRTATTTIALVEGSPVNLGTLDVRTP